IRIAYAFQTLGIMGLLGYDVVSNGLGSIKEDPLWVVLIVSTVVLAFMSHGSDERLALKNLRKIRVAFAVQALGIIGVLGYYLVAGGYEDIYKSPLNILFSLSILILIFLSMNITVDYENSRKHAGKGLAISIIVLLFASLAM